MTSLSLFRVKQVWVPLFHISEVNSKYAFFYQGDIREGGF